MGKKAKLKKIRRLANQLPPIITKQVFGERLTAKEAMMQGINEVEGKPFGQDAIITKKKLVEKPLNHNRKMKKLYNKLGAVGVNHYVNAVHQYVKSKQDAV